jgi:GH3 auxin-responsive promoter
MLRSLPLNAGAAVMQLSGSQFNAAANNELKNLARSLPLARARLVSSQEASWSALRDSLKGTQIYDALCLADIPTYSEYLRHVPVHDYDYFEPFVASVEDGAPNVLFTDPCEHFALTSGSGELIAGAVLVYFSGYSLIRLGQPRAASRYVGFVRSISLVLMNPNILLIDLTLIAEALALTQKKQADALYLYGLGVVVGTAAVIGLVRWRQRLFARWRKPLEVAASVFFLVIGFELLADVFVARFY